jgi:myo-inositol-1(or 4)-monophosphatase
MSDIDLEELRSWVREAGATARRYFNHVEGRRKADHSWVTEADVAIERALVERLAARYPQHGIIGEEQTRQGIEREFLWALDPLDGTASFVAGLPTWGVSLGLLRAGLPYLGVVYLPLLDDCYWAGPTGDAFLNGRAIRVAAPHDWEGEDWIVVPSNSHRRFAIDFVGKARALGCTAASFCYAARGGAIGAVVTRAAIWDIAAGLAILRAAGGVAIGLSGAPLDPAPLLDGRLLPEPLIIGAETHVAGLRSVIRDRGPA